MNTTTKILIGIGIFVVLLVIAEMSISTFFASKYAEQHGDEGPAIHLH